MTTYAPLPEAAARLGISQSALRRRLRAGTAQGERRPSAGGFAWWVACEEPQAPPTPSLEVAHQEHLADLRKRVDDQAREIAELHRLLAQAHQLALAPPPAASTLEETQSAPPAADPAGRSWWRRLWQVWALSP